MSPDFKKLESREIVPIGYQRLNFHTIFDVKMEYFRSKASLVAGGNVTEPPATITYGRVVTRETVMIDMKLDALNDLPIKLADIQNA